MKTQYRIVRESDSAEICALNALGLVETVFVKLFTIGMLPDNVPLGAATGREVWDMVAFKMILSNVKVEYEYE